MTTEAELVAACALPEGSEARYAEVVAEVQRLEASDPDRERQRLEVLSDNIGHLLRRTQKLAELGSATSVDRLDTLRAAAQSAREAARVASARDFTSTPVQGVGTEAWRMLWQAASSFGREADGYSHPYVMTADGERCVLCQQTLSQSAKDRLQHFENFMADTTETEALLAEQRVAATLSNLRNDRVRPGSVDRALLGFSSHDSLLAQSVSSAFDRLETHIDGLVSGSTGSIEDETIPGTLHALSALQGELETRAATLNSVGFRSLLASTVEQRNSLSDLVAVARSQEAIGEEVSRLRICARIEAAKREVDTTGITRKSTDLTRDYVTTFARDLFTREAERLRLRRVTLADGGGVKGKLQHRPELLGAGRNVSVTDVLSEGEQTALGLAGFLTEAQLDESRSTMMLDDPVTSLDHDRRGFVAERLIELARSRQVIVLTHEASFVADLLTEARDKDVPVCERAVERRADVPGYCVDSLPWKAKDVGRRLDDLTQQLAAIKRERASMSDDAYETACALWAGRLSESWERAVNVELVGQVVDRGTHEVKPRMFRIFVKIDEEDDRDFQAGYSQCSLWAKRHDKAPEVNYVAPDPQEMDGELARFRAWFKRLKGYREVN
jgi:hypothetical protein